MNALVTIVSAISLIQGSASLESPSNDIKALFSLDKGRVTVELMRGNAVLTEPSPLGIVVNGTDRGNGIGAISFDESKVVKRHLELRVEKQSADVSWRESTLAASDSQRTKLLIDVRLFDEGFAYRYRLPNPETSGKCEIEKEESSARLPLGSKVWTQDYLNANLANEGIWSETPVGGINGVRSGPVTVELPAPNGFLFISEAGNYGLDYSGSKYLILGDRVQHWFAHDPQGFTIAKPNFVSPWRVIVTARDLTGLVNQTIVAALAPEPDAKLFPQGVRTPWCRPGRAAWSFFTRGYHEGNATSKDQEEQFIDIAGALGFEYNMTDEGWYGWKNGGKDQWQNMSDLVQRGAKKGVQEWAWIYYPLQVNNPANDWQQMRDFFDSLVRVGVVGIEIDFLNSESQERRRFYDAALRLSAERKLMIQFHGANIPTGESQSWPNEITREGIHGLENNLWFGLSGQHYTALPFTRFVAGPGCFTPGYLGHRQELLKGSSWPLQLATMVAYNSLFLQSPLAPDVLEDALPPNSAQRDLVRALPVAWDETKVLPQARIGRYAPFARRKGSDWWIAVLNGDDARSESLDLSFLPPGMYDAILISDLAEKNDGWRIDKRSVTNDTRLTIDLRASGGFVAWIRPKR
ncbi:MAG: glycoside hydrolase family 97 catalytic domain-containing protein [Fimbriimonas sp.]|nr:glycoside hydrolase family 97 catalytic domain-containing protein [Fimbriimonas sp.]